MQQQSSNLQRRAKWYTHYKWIYFARGSYGICISFRNVLPKCHKNENDRWGLIMMVIFHCLTPATKTFHMSKTLCVCEVVLSFRDILGVCNLYWPNRPISQIPECYCAISQYATFVPEMCTCVHISVTKWCIVGYLSDALWDLWEGSTTSITVVSY